MRKKRAIDLLVACLPVSFMAATNADQEHPPSDSHTKLQAEIDAGPSMLHKLDYEDAPNLEMGKENIQQENISAKDLSQSERAQNYRQRVARIVAEHLGVDERKAYQCASFIEDLGADSLDVVELVMAFEEEFLVQIPDEAAEKMLNVCDVVEYLDRNKRR